MKNAMDRPEPKFGAGADLYRNDMFQIAYVTNDIERALKVFADRYGAKEWRRIEGELKARGHIRVEFGWAGGSLFEVTQARAGPLRRRARQAGLLARLFPARRRRGADHRAREARRAARSPARRHAARHARAEPAEALRRRVHACQRRRHW
jgi:hypothetical protein